MKLLYQKAFGSHINHILSAKKETCKDTKNVANLRLILKII